MGRWPWEQAQVQPEQMSRVLGKPVQQVLVRRMVFLPTVQWQAKHHPGHRRGGYHHR